MGLIVLLIFIATETNKTTYENQIPFDVEAKIYEIDYAWAHRIEFFKDYTTLQKALLFLQPDSSYVIEVYSKKDGIITKERITVELETVIQIQQAISSIKAKETPRVVYDRSGYAKFLRNSFLFAYTIQAPLLVLAISPDDFRTGFGLYLLSSAGGFIIPLMLTKKCNVTKAHADMHLNGGIHGLYIAGALSEIFGRNYYEGTGAFFTVMGSLFGGYMGFQSVNKFKLNQGRGNTIFVIGDFCGASAAGILSLFDNWSSRVYTHKHYLAASILGLGSGFFLGSSITRNLELSPGDPLIFGNCGIIGGATLPLILFWIDNEKTHISEKFYISAGITGLGLGSVLGYKIV
jgi:hypothetical protein